MKDKDKAKEHKKVSRLLQGPIITPKGGKHKTSKLDELEKLSNTLSEEELEDEID